MAFNDSFQCLSVPLPIWNGLFQEKPPSIFPFVAPFWTRKPTPLFLEQFSQSGRENVHNNVYHPKIVQLLLWIRHEGVLNELQREFRWLAYDNCGEHNIIGGSYAARSVCVYSTGYSPNCCFQFLIKEIRRDNNLINVSKSRAYNVH